MMLPQLEAVKLAAKNATLWIALCILVATNSCSYLVGRAHKGTSYANKELKVAKNEAKAIAKEAAKRAPQVAAKEAAAATQTQRVEDIKRNIAHATEARPVNTNCNLSDAELNGYVLLSEEINAATKRGSVQR